MRCPFMATALFHGILGARSPCPCGSSHLPLSSNATSPCWWNPNDKYACQPTKHLGKIKMFKISSQFLADINFVVLTHVANSLLSLLMPSGQSLRGCSSGMRCSLHWWPISDHSPSVAPNNKGLRGWWPPSAISKGLTQKSTADHGHIMCCPKQQFLVAPGVLDQIVWKRGKRKHEPWAIASKSNPENGQNIHQVQLNRMFSTTVKTPNCQHNHYHGGRNQLIRLTDFAPADEGSTDYLWAKQTDSGAWCAEYMEEADIPSMMVFEYIWSMAEYQTTCGLNWLHDWCSMYSISNIRLWKYMVHMCDWWFPKKTTGDFSGCLWGKECVYHPHRPRLVPPHGHSHGGSSGGRSGGAKPRHFPEGWPQSHSKLYHSINNDSNNNKKNEHNHTTTIIIDKLM